MVFSSTLFLVYFLPVFVLIYHFIDRKYKNYFVLAASIFFYAWGAPKFVFVILGSTIIDFFVVKKMHQSNDEKQRKTLLIASICINLGLLIYFKYANFFVENVNGFLSLFGVEPMKWVKVALPIGISFYTFQTLTYSIDIYRRLHAPLEKVTDYLLYIMSFPQMIAGPIVRFTTIADQIVHRPDSLDDRLYGFYRFCIGLAKKVLIANVMAEQADLIFNGNLTELNAPTAILGMVAYTFQIYFDFSGYSDMAIGLGRMIGFRFPENFNTPYISKNISEFWRRWHITLGDFMKNYLYIPLGGSKVSSAQRLYFNLMIVFLLSGLWHGASWNYILWGMYHGLFLILDRLFLVDVLKKAGSFVSILFTFIVVMFGWVLFRLEELNKIGLFFQSFSSWDSIQPFTIIPSFVTLLIIAVFFSFMTSFKWGRNIQTYFYNNHALNGMEHTLFTLGSLILFILSLSSITSSGFNPFIYFRF